MADAKKIANNILDFLIDPTKVPVMQRVYFRPEEILKNETYEGTKADVQKAYRDQSKNSDFYPQRNRSTKREAVQMDRKSMIASLDILSKNFQEKDVIGVQLRTMAAAVSKIDDETYASRCAEDAPGFEGMSVEASEMTIEAKKKGETECPKCGQRLFCMTCAKGGKKKEETVEASAYTDFVKKFMKENPGKSIGEAAKAWKKQAGEEEVQSSVEDNDFWSREASESVAQALVSDVIGTSDADADDAPIPEGEGAPEGEEAPAPAKTPAKKKKAPVEEEEEAVPAPAPAPKEAAMKKEEELDDLPPAPEPVMPPPAPEAKGVEISIKVNKEAEKKPAGKLIIEEEGKNKESTVVDTDVLASIEFEGISMNNEMLTADDVKGMSQEEMDTLASLFKHE